jgi:hypothetical protein
MKKGGHPEWRFKRNRYSVPIAEKRSPSPQKSRSSSHPRAILMSPSVVLIADRPEELNVLAVVAARDVALARCSQRFARNVAKRLRYPSSLAATSRYTAEIAS